MLPTVLLVVAMSLPGQRFRQRNVLPAPPPKTVAAASTSKPQQSTPPAISGALATGYEAPTAISPGSHEFADAIADRQNFPPTDQPFLFYFTTLPFHPEDRVMAEASLAYVVASLSHKVDLTFQLPVKISDTLHRIDLRGLGWEHVWHKAIVHHYPYKWNKDANQHLLSPLVIRADWFIADGYDGSRTGDFQYLLLYGSTPPKTRAEFLDFWGVAVSDQEYVFGMIEGESGVSVQGTRQIETHPTSKRGYSYLTKDSRRIAGDTDPLENLPNGALFDAQEYIVGMYKVRNGRSGNLNAYFLTDGNNKNKDGTFQKGTRQEKAPVDIVEERLNIRGREICNSASCVFCHVTGLLHPTKNAYREFIKDPTRLFNDLDTRYKIERYQGSDIQKEISRHQQDYADGIAIVNGLDPIKNSLHFSSCVQAYAGNADLEQVARELAVLYGDRLTGRELQLALGYASDRKLLKARLAQLAEGRTISRDMVMENFFDLQEIIALWTAKTK